MKKLSIVIATLLMSIFLLSLITAQTYSIDISGLKGGEYSIGEEINFKVVLLEDGKILIKEVDVRFADALEKKEITKKVQSNRETSIKIDNDFLSGLWTVTASYLNAKVDRTFVIGENPEAEFIIEKDELIIRNHGNVRYTKTIQIKIGGKTSSYTQNIGIGEEKVLKLISPEGIYNIEVTDGKNTIKRENVQLYGTGNVVGAVDKNLLGYTGLAGADDPTLGEDKIISLNRLPIALVFVATVAVLAVLVIVERRLSARKNKKTKRKK